MKIFVAAFALSLALLSPFAGPASAQSTKTEKKIPTPKASMKGVGTAKIIKGTKNAGRQVEGGAGKGARRVGKTVSKGSRRVAKFLSGQDRKKNESPSTGKP